jgi:hypothetical protein
MPLSLQDGRRRERIKMKSISPIIPGFESEEVVYAKNQPEYIPLPALPVEDGTRIITRWRFSWRERIRVLFSGDIYLWVLTFKGPLQPVMLDTEAPQLGRTVKGRR